jgi:signal transduction histidine kinase/DNA-binding response OmpR family regulator/CHASE3 domain sensor protein
VRLGLTGRMLAASGVLAALVAAVFAVVVIEIYDLRESSRLAKRAADVAAEANELERLAIDLQTGSRGFVITGQERFLDPVRAAREDLPGREARLERLIVDPGQQSRARAIARRIRAYDREYVTPLLARARRSLAAARETVASGAGKMRVDAIRAEFDRFHAAQRELELRRDREAQNHARRAVLFGFSGLVGSLLLILLFAGFLTGSIVAPVRRLSTAAGHLAGGDLAARVAERGAGEVGALARVFNRMAESLQESRDELESQKIELEAQQAELEDAVGSLTEEKERVEAFYGFGELLIGETSGGSFPSRVLQEISDFARADIGVLYTASEESADALHLAATRGVDPSRLPPELSQTEGLPGRALSEGRPVTASYGETGLRLQAFGEELTVRHELHVPLLQDDHTRGLLTLARVGERPFSHEEIEAIEHLGRQAAVSFASRLAFTSVRKLANINSAVLDATLDGIRMVDLEGNVLISNRAYEKIAAGIPGLSQEESREEQTERIAEMTADPAGFRALAEKIKADPDYSGMHELELPELRRSFHLYTTPVRDSAGAQIGRMSVVREVTAEHEAERLKSDLVSTVSHELRTPLASVLGFTELLLERELDAETQERYLRTVYNEARRLTALINDFLDLQRIEEGSFTLALEPFELTALLGDQVALFSAQSERHNLMLEHSGRPLNVTGERDRIAQVVGNLISNAIKYSPKGGPVKVEAEQRNGSIRVAVRDRGLGIPADQQRKLFTKFFRVDTSDTREIGGTGLGLALVRELVEAHGGRVGFESEEGAGSTFWFELPTTASASVGGNGATSRNGRVLVVEDDPAAAALLTEYLAEDGFAVEVVSTGEDAIARATADPPTLVCLDITLASELDGWDVLARLKDDARTAHVPVVICTARNGRERAGVLGASDFLTKPFSSPQLRATIGRLLPASEGSVLVVDDDPAVRRLVVETLRAEGVELREAADGHAALKEIEERRPDVLVLDLALPDLDGFAVLERLQSDPALRTLPVVVLTGTSLSDHERAQLETRAIALLQKSFYSPQELRRLIRRVLGQQALDGVEQLERAEGLR